MQGKEESHRRRSWLLVQKDDQKGRDNNGLMEMWRHLSMWRPQPKPPDAGSQPLTAIIVVTAEELISGESTSFMSILVENDLEKVRVKWGINDAIKENGSMDKVGISINSMAGQLFPLSSVCVCCIINKCQSPFPLLLVRVMSLA
ncbi:hypothetical protein TSUD_132280 [Trifolium subterraneum]|uniref:Uncharacterized protein n=1 Tax=Trifolium subterraneum TaxID=3900 RepID=A0A2Z6P1E5_TRISU|nr:hypothetical protein TSUD_132280 [Trifolium subterraneum]